MIRVAETILPNQTQDKCNKVRVWAGRGPARTWGWRLLARDLRVPNLRSRWQHKARGVSPGYHRINVPKPAGGRQIWSSPRAARRRSPLDSKDCRPFRGLVCD